MEKRSRRRTRDLVTQSAYQGLSENENGCARISMMARSTNALFTGRIQKRKTNPLRHSNLACNTRPVHTVGSGAADPVVGRDDGFAPTSRRRGGKLRRPIRATSSLMRCNKYKERPVPLQPPPR